MNEKLSALPNGSAYHVTIRQYKAVDRPSVYVEIFPNGKEFGGRVTITRGVRLGTDTVEPAHISWSSNSNAGPEWMIKALKDAIYIRDGLDQHRETEIFEYNNEPYYTHQAARIDGS